MKEIIKTSNSNEISCHTAVFFLSLAFFEPFFLLEPPDYYK